MRLGPIVVQILLVLALIVPHESQGHPDQYITSAELKVVLQTQDTYQIVEALNRAKRSQRSSELMSFLLGLWQGQERPRDLPWDIIESARIRIEIANVLIQASNNGLIKFNRTEAHAYSRRIVNGTEEDAKVTAILNLGLIADPGDIELLKEIALREEPQTFRVAVIALAEMCGPRGAMALAEIRTQVKGSDNREFANTPLDDLAPFKRCRRHAP